MKLQKLTPPVVDYQIVDKVNEIIDLLNNSFITQDADTITVNDLKSVVDITCDTLTPRTNEHTLNNDHIFKDIYSNPVTNKKCPHCGASHYTPGVSYTTAVYYPPIYKDGVNINAGKNSTTTQYHCLACNTNWEERT